MYEFGIVDLFEVSVGVFVCVLSGEDFGVEGCLLDLYCVYVCWFV